MPDHDAFDPMDKAYAQAEAVLSDDDTRAARRARVLAAVAREGAAAPAEAPPAPRRPVWRRSGWLVAASVAGVSLYFSTQLYEPVSPPPRPAPTASEGAAAPVAPVTPQAPTAAPPEPARAPSADDAAPALARKPTAQAVAPAPRRAGPETDNLARAAPAQMAPAAPEAFPSAAPPPPPPMEGVVTARRREESLTQPLASQERRREDVDSIVVTARKREKVGSAATAGRPDTWTSRKAGAPDPGARLRDAAAAGRLAEVTDLLDRGAAIDATDADGETALMKSIQSDQPAAAALLRRRGASLDRRNHAGDSARDMAAALDNPDLNRSLGLEP